MRTKALVLGSLGLAAECAWVNISEGKSWRCRVETRPDTADLDIRVRLDVELDGKVQPHSILGSKFWGSRVRFVIEEVLVGVELISAFVDEVSENEPL